VSNAGSLSTDAGLTAVQTIDGDIGSASGTTITFIGGSAGLIFTASGSMVTVSEPQPVTVTGNKTLGLSDANATQNCTAAAQITIPPNSTQAFPINTIIPIVRNTSGAVALVAGVGVTFLSVLNQFGVMAQNGTIFAYKMLIDTWVISGATGP